MFGVDPAYLAAGLDEMHDRFGSIEGYFSDGLGLDAPTIDALRGAFTEAARLIRPADGSWASRPCGGTQ